MKVSGYRGALASRGEITSVEELGRMGWQGKHGQLVVIADLKPSSLAAERATPFTDKKSVSSGLYFPTDRKPCLPE